MKKLIAIMLVAVMVFALCACGQETSSTASTAPAENAETATAAAAGEARVIKLGHSVTETSAWHQGALKFAEAVEEKTNGY